MNKKKLAIIIGLIVTMIAAVFIINRLFFGVSQTEVGKIVFIVNRNQTEDQTLDKLKNQGLTLFQKTGGLGSLPENLLPLLI